MQNQWSSAIVKGELNSSEMKWHDRNYWPTDRMNRECVNEKRIVEERFDKWLVERMIEYMDKWLSSDLVNQ